MKKLTIILVLMFAVVSLSGYRAFAVEDLIDDSTVVTEVETDTCLMNEGGVPRQDRVGKALGQMTNRGERKFQHMNTSQTPREDCPCLDDAE
jgi:hypothetical protein